MLPPLMSISERVSMAWQPYVVMTLNAIHWMVISFYFITEHIMQSKLSFMMAKASAYLPNDYPKGDLFIKIEVILSSTNKFAIGLFK